MNREAAPFLRHESSPQADQRLQPTGHFGAVDRL